MADTSIRVSEELADELYDRKGRSTSYEEFIWELIERADAHEATADAGRTARDSSPAQDAHADAAERRREALRKELAGSGDLAERRVDAILSMYDVLRERGSAEKDELLDAVDVDTTDYASRDSVWANMVKGKDTLRALPGVEPPPSGKTTWRYNA